MSLFPRKKVLVITLYIMIVTKSTKGKFREIFFVKIRSIVLILS